VIFVALVVHDVRGASSFYPFFFLLHLVLFPVNRFSGLTGGLFEASVAGAPPLESDLRPFGDGGVIESFGGLVESVPKGVDTVQRRLFGATTAGAALHIVGRSGLFDHNDIVASVVAATILGSKAAHGAAGLSNASIVELSFRYNL